MNILEDNYQEGGQLSFTAYVDVEGKMKHKSSVIRMLFNENVDKTSVDRFRRVRSYSSYPDPCQSDETVNEDIELDEMVMIGDTLCGKVALKDGKACLAIAKITSIRDIQNKKFLTVSGIEKMEGLQFQVKVCHVSATEEKLQMLGTSSGLLTWKGSHCISIQLSNSELAISKA